MSETKKCPDCGAEMPAASACPHCLLGLALAPGAAENTGELTETPQPPHSEGPALGPVCGQATDGPAFALLAPVTEKAGDRIGHYKLLNKLGEGGCGVVYLAEQEEPVQRQVALKVIKLGMDTKQVIARFEAERQALALMDHPNIAKVFDAGATGAGRPFFVMELIKGVPLTRYCDEQKLKTAERLALFNQVCQAIQHAHQKGIIHRDIKPSNVLVAGTGPAATPKVIDFGIAKATTDQLLTDKTLFTALEQFLGTPAYMSPEQAGLSGVDIDTRSDIYSLGVLLYELLTGKTPFDAKRLVEAGLDEVRRIIREEEPPRPSTRLSTLGQEEQTTDAGLRQAAPIKLVSLLRGDLDWIAMKALEKDRARRYETASGLAMDIQRHLNNEPVVARPPSNLYRFRRLVRRNRLAFAAGTAVVCSLAIGLALSTILFFRQKAANVRATEQALIAQTVNGFFTDDLLNQADSTVQADAKSEPNPNLTVREALERASKRIGDRFKDQPLVEAAIQLSIGNAFRGIGEGERALPHLKRALELRKVRLGANDPQTLRAMGHLAEAYMVAGKPEEALPLLEQTLKLQKTSLGPDQPDTITSMNILASAYLDTGKLPQAIALLEEGLELSKQRRGPEDPETLTFMNDLAEAYRAAGKIDRALPLYEKTLALRTAKIGRDHPYTIASMNNLALCYQAAGRLDKAIPLLEAALPLRQARLGPDHPETLGSMNNLAAAYHQAGKRDQALPLFKESFTLLKAKLGPDHPSTLGMMLGLGSAYLNARKPAEAEPVCEEAFQICKTKLGPDHPYTLHAMGLLALAYEDSGKLKQAIPVLEQNYALLKAKLGPDHPDTVTCMNNLAQAYRDAGSLDKALPMAEQAFALLKAKVGPDQRITLLAMNNLARTYQATGKLDQAVPLFEAALQLRKTKLGPQHPDTLTTLTNLAAAYREANQPAKAEQLLQQSR